MNYTVEKDPLYELSQTDLFNFHSLTPHQEFSKQYIIEYNSGFKVSLVQSSFSYGNKENLWEGAVLAPQGGFYQMPGQSDDVIGYLDAKKAMSLLLEVSDLF